MKHHVRLALAFATIVGCGRASRPPDPESPAPPTASVQPGRATHFSRIDEMTLLAGQVLVSPFEMTPTSAPGAVSTEWETLDARRWPGVLVRVAVEISGRHVTVRVQCRRDGASCTDRVPDAARLAKLAQSIADGIVERSQSHRVLSRFRDFKDEACACRDLECFEQIDQSLSTWALEEREVWRATETTRAYDAEADRIGDAMDACKEALESKDPPYVRFAWDSTGSDACDEYLLTFDAVAMKCRARFGPAYVAIKQSRDELAASFAEWATLDAVTRQAAIDAAETGCLSATDALRQSAVAMGCPL